MPDPLPLAAAIIPLLGALLLLVRGAARGRAVVLGSSGAALALSILSSALDPLSRLAVVLYSGVAFLTLLAAPQRDRVREHRADALLILGGTLAVFATGNLLILLGGWILSALPLWRRAERGGASWAVPRLILAGGTLALAASIGLMAWDAAAAGSSSPFSLASLRKLRVADNGWVFGLVIAAVLSRKSVVPLHSSLVTACERASLLNTMLYLNGHLGVYLIARLAMPLMPTASHQALSPLADLALLSAVLTAVMALTEKSPRRLLGLLSISQMSFLLAGLESTSSAGLNGAIAYLVVLSMSTAGLFIVLRLLEVRLDAPLALDRFHGLGGRAPRLAAFFLVSALALVGLPGTLGYVAEDLLFHGTLDSHPELGLVMPLATALNAISLLRMFARLFFGRRTLHVPALADALPAERWALTAALAAMAVLGIRPELLLTFTRAAVAGLAP
jgi:NADH-quinone oxidoreductase subunit M